MKFLVILLSAFALSAQATDLEKTAEVAPKQMPAEVVALHKVLHAGSCDDGIDAATDFEMHPITDRTNLYIVPCLHGAYNTTSVAYLKQGSLAPVPVYVLMQYPAIEIENSPAAIVSTPYMTDASYDMESQRINTTAKDRGLGDCGQSSSSVLHVSHFGAVYVKTVEIRAKVDCDGSLEGEWPVVFKQ